MEFRILGPLELVSSGGDAVAVSRPLMRAAIFALALHAGKPLTSERLIGLLWGDDSRDRSHALRTCVWDIRQVLPSQRLVTDDIGYRLHIDHRHDKIDLTDFRELCRDGRAAQRQGDIATAADLFERALGLWRDPPLADLLPKTIAMKAFLTGLEQERNGARDTLFDARLALGEHRDLLPELRTLVAQEPLNEHLRALLMLALHRYGRKAEALNIFDDACVVLHEETGTKPGVELQRLRLQILDGDPALDLPVTASPKPNPAVCTSTEGSGTGSVVPIAQLPPDVTGFTGRAKERAELKAMLTLDAGATAVSIVEVTGPPGVGKTCLAVHMAHTVRELYPDGQLYLQLAGASPRPREPGAVLREILCVLGVPAAEIPDTTEQRAAVFRSRLADRRVLVVADDAASLNQVRPLLPGTAGCAVVITTRVQLTVVADAHLINLEPLEKPEALTMLGHIIGRSRLDTEHNAAESVVTACGGFPLAVRIAGARLAARPSWPISRLADLLADEQQRLDQLVVGDLAVRASIALSYQALDERAQRTFRLLALVGPHAVAGWVVAVLLDEPNADDVLEALVDRGLLTAVGVDALGEPRYRLHDLLRDYAGELLAGDPQYEPARERLITAWLWLVDRADEHMPREPYFPAPPRFSKTTGIESADRMVSDDPRIWLSVERPNILTVIDTACAAGKYRLAVDLALRLAAYLMVHGHHDDAEGMWRRVTNAAEHAGDSEVAAKTRLRAAVVIAHDRGRHAAAMPMADACVAAFERIEDRQHLARALALRAYCAQALTRLAIAQDAAERGLSLARKTGDAHAEFSCHRILGHTMSQLGRQDQAARHSEEALTVARRLGEASYEAIALYTVIQVLLDAGRYDRVPELCEQGLELAARIGSELATGYYRQQMGVARQGLGRHDAAIDELSAALRAFESQRADRAAAFCRRKLADSLRQIGCFDGAAENLEGCLPIFQTLGLAAEERETRVELTACREQMKNP